MKKCLITAGVIAIFPVAMANAGVNIDVNIGAPVAVAVPQPPPPAIEPPQMVIEAPPQFIFSPALGFYVTVGIPYDIVYLDRNYYVYRSGSWYVAPSYRGPWTMAPRRILPPGLRRFRYEQIRRYRDAEYREYMRDRDHYRGRWHSPAEERREERRERH